MSDVGFASPVNTPRGNGEMAQYGSDASLFVTFYMERVYQEYESEAKGKPIWKDEEFVHILQPGAKTDIKRKVRRVMPNGSGIPSDPERFPRQWQAFQNKQEQAQSGTPIEEFAPMPNAIRDDFKTCRIHTVEQLAAVHDGNAGQLPLEWRKWRDKAQAWLKSAEDKAPVLAMQAELERMRAELSALKENGAVATAPVKRRGRPPKVQVQPSSEGETQ